MCRIRETVFWGRQKICNHLRKYSSRDQRVQQQNTQQKLSNNYLFEWIVPKEIKNKHSGTSPSHLVQSPDPLCPRPLWIEKFPRYCDKVALNRGEPQINFHHEYCDMWKTAHYFRGSSISAPTVYVLVLISKEETRLYTNEEVHFWSSLCHATLRAKQNIES